MTNAISWAAVSSRPQADRESLHEQHRLNHALAEALDWDIVEEITVPGQSRSYHRLADARANIEAYPRLMEIVESGAIDWLICKDRSRLGRTRRLNQEVAGVLQDHGVRVYSRTLPPASTERRTESDVWGEAIEGGFSEAEILRLVQRREMGMQARVRAGKLPSAPPWGFRYTVTSDGRRPVFCDPQAEQVIRFIVERFLEGVSKRQIGRSANSPPRAWRTRSGRPWHLSSIDAVLFQPAYYGLVAFGRRRHVVENGRKVNRRTPPEEWIIAEAEFDGLFTPDDWRRVMAEQRRRVQEHPRRRASRYPLSGIAWCSVCDWPMVGSSSRGRRYYRCEDPDYYGSTDVSRRRGRHYLRRGPLHHQVGQYLQSLATDPKQLQALLEELPEGAEERWEEERSNLLAQQEELARRRKRWSDAYETGVIGLADYAGHVSTLDRQEESVARQLQQVESRLSQAEERIDHAERLREAIATLPQMLGEELTDERSQILRATFSRYLHRVHIQDKAVIRIDFRTP